MSLFINILSRRISVDFGFVSPCGQDIRTACSVIDQEA